MSSKTSQNLLLIECVKKHEILYDSNAKEYNDAQFKTKIWEQIAKDCGFLTGNQAKSSWKNLRDGYRCSIKTAKAGKGSDATKKMKPWKFMHEMSFLAPFMKDRSKSSNILSEDQSSSNLNETQSEDDYLNCSIHDNSTDKEDYNEEQTSQFSESLSISTEKRKENPLLGLDIVSNSVSKKCKLSSDIFLKEQTRKPEERSELGHRKSDRLPQSSNNSLKLFFDSMYEATKILPARQQRQIKSSLFNAVCDAEDLAEYPTISSATSDSFPLIDTDDLKEQEINYDYSVLDVVQI